jgi:hypothetical protein
MPNSNPMQGSKASMLTFSAIPNIKKKNTKGIKNPKKAFTFETNKTKRLLYLSWISNSNPKHIKPSQDAKI